MVLECPGAALWRAVEGSDSRGLLLEAGQQGGELGRRHGQVTVLPVSPLEAL